MISACEGLAIKGHLQTLFHLNLKKKEQTVLLKVNKRGPRLYVIVLLLKPPKDSIVCSYNYGKFNMDHKSSTHTNTMHEKESSRGF